MLLYYTLKVGDMDSDVDSKWMIIVELMAESWQAPKNKLLDSTRNQSDYHFTIDSMLTCCLTSC